MADENETPPAGDNVVPLRPAQKRAPPTPGGFVIAAEEMLNKFEQRYAGRLRFVPEWGYWVEWGGAVWRRDYCALNKAVTLLSELGKERGGKERSKIDSYHMISSTERLARCSPVFSAPVAWFDADPWKLNTPGGVVDLRTGELRPAKPEDYCTKITAVAPTFGAPRPRWDGFLARVTAGDAELAAYLMRVLGYCLTGETTEQCLFFLYGTGANGKSVFLNTVQNILADYATTAVMEIFAVTNHEPHKEALACLRGARLVLASETEEGKAWNDAKIKQLTGGDKIRANFMRQDSFDYRPNFKLLIAGNHKPTLKSVDEAIQRRQQIVPFTVTIPPGERDHTLTDKLCAEEGGAILADMIAACLEWAAHGLRPPEAVSAAVKEYVQDEDVIGQWLEECCSLGNSTTSETPAALFKSWKAWAESHSEFVLSQNRLTRRLKARGLAQFKEPGGGRRFKGIMLKPPPDNRAPEPAEDRPES